MTNFEKLLEIEQKDEIHQLEVKEKKTGNIGIVNVCNDNTVKFYIYNGNENGSDDKIISMNEFNNNFEIMAILNS